MLRSHLAVYKKTNNEVGREGFLPSYRRTASMPRPFGLIPTKPAVLVATNETKAMLLRNISYQLINREKMRYDKFNGLTFSEHLEKMESDIIRETPPIVHESFRSYVYGIGLSIILDVNIINRAAIEQAITQFRLLNETDWQAAIPVPRERLPVVSEQQAFAAI
jgi:hypothetical protein